MISFVFPINVAILYLVLVLYIQEFAKISLYVLLLIGFFIKSPIFLTDAISPSSTVILSDICSNSDSTPVNLNSTFLSVFPSSYPKYVSLLLIVSVDVICPSIPVHPKNWLTLLDV